MQDYNREMDERVYYIDMNATMDMLRNSLTAWSVLSQHYPLVNVRSSILTDFYASYLIVILILSCGLLGINHSTKQTAVDNEQWLNERLW